MPINEMEFTILENDISETGKSLLDYLAPEIGKVYVTAITRDRCPACEKQRPKLNELANSIAKKYRDKVVFARIHVRQPAGSPEESSRSKDMLRHYFYPTNVIALKTKDRESIEYYRNVSPEMDELKKNIEIAVEIATMIEKQTT